MERGLVTIHAAGPMLPTYLNTEVGVVVGAGFRPPLAEGFSSFLQAVGTVTMVEEAVRESTVEPPDPFDSHPSLSARLTALHDAPHLPAPDPDPPAIELIRDTPKLEEELIRWIASAKLEGLEPIEWVDAVQKVWLPYWEEQCRVAREALGGVTPASLPESWHQGSVPPGAAGRKWGPLVGGALAVLLAARGWSIAAAPGEPVRATRDGKVIEPFSVVPRLRSEEISADEWRAICRDAGIAEVDLGTIGDATP